MNIAWVKLACFMTLQITRFLKQTPGLDTHTICVLAVLDGGSLQPIITSIAPVNHQLDRTRERLVHDGKHFLREQWKGREGLDLSFVDELFPISTDMSSMKPLNQRAPDKFQI